MTSAGALALTGLGAVALIALVKWDADRRWTSTGAPSAANVARERLARAVTRAETSTSAPTVRLHALSAEVIRTLQALEESGARPGDRVYLRRR